MTLYRILSVVLLLAGRAAALDLSRAVIVSREPGRAAAVLSEEVARRSQIRWSVFSAAPSTGPAVVIERSRTGGPAEGYTILIRGDRVLVSGNDALGLLFGVGRLLRELRIDAQHVELPDTFQIASAPKVALRGHQLGYRPKTNSYDGWDVAQWDRYIRELALFGTNAIELIPPVSDDAPSSPHFPLPPMPMMIEMSRIAASYGLQVWVWYPAINGDFSNPGVVAKSVQDWAEVVRQLPRVDAVFVPGGDPGRTPPKALFALLEKQTASLRRYHPKLQMWVSPQSFGQQWMDDFFALMNQQPSWLAGVAYGPEVRMDIGELRRRIPARYPIRDYPDITHTTHAQYVPPDWDLAFALTHNREPINPRSLDMRSIFRHNLPYTIGFIAYSEGCADDVNKFVWSSLGWDPDADLHDLLRQYARLFIGSQFADSFAQGLFALERNWRGPLATNSGVETTLQQFRKMEASAPPKLLLNWRFQMALYRAYYDAYVRRRLLAETEAEQQANDLLRRAGELGTLPALAEAERRLAPSAVAPDLRSRIETLAEALFQSIRLQLSVTRYAALARERGATLDNVDTPLNNAPWLRARFAVIRQLGSEAGRLAAIDRILNWTNPGPGGFYDDLGDPALSPHLVRPVSYDEDPGHLRTPLTGVARRYWTFKEPWRLSWLSDAESMFDAPVEMRYTGLDPDGSYRVRLIYGGEEGAMRTIRLTANDRFEVHPFQRIENLTEPLEYSIPHEATAGGELQLRWVKTPGLPGAGRGCQVAEVWLIRAQ